VEIPKGGLNDYGIPKAWGAERFGIPRARGDRAFWKARQGGLDEDAACGRVWIFSGITH